MGCPFLFVKTIYISQMIFNLLFSALQGAFAGSHILKNQLLVYILMYQINVKFITGSTFTKIVPQRVHLQSVQSATAINPVLEKKIYSILFAYLSKHSGRLINTLPTHHQFRCEPKQKNRSKLYNTLWIGYALYYRSPYGQPSNQMTTHSSAAAYKRLNKCLLRVFV